MVLRRPGPGDCEREPTWRRSAPVLPEPLQQRCSCRRESERSPHPHLVDPSSDVEGRAKPQQGRPSPLRQPTAPPGARGHPSATGSEVQASRALFWTPAEVRVLLARARGTSATAGSGYGPVLRLFRNSSETHRHFQSTTHWGACGKPPVGAENHHLDPRMLPDVGFAKCGIGGVCCRPTDFAGASNRWPEPADHRSYRGRWLMAIAAPTPRHLSNHAH